jgi:hypothetical protein
MVERGGSELSVPLAERKKALDAANHRNRPRHAIKDSYEATNFGYQAIEAEKYSA